MKIGRTKVLSLILTFVFVLLMVPALDVFAYPDNKDCKVQFATLTDYESKTLDTLQGSAKWNHETKTLTLNNAKLINSGSDERCGFRFECDATIIVIGNNEISVTSTGNDVYGVINMYGTHKLTIQGDELDNYTGTLTVNSTADEDSFAIWGVSPKLTISNLGCLNINVTADNSGYGVRNYSKPLDVDIKNSCVNVDVTKADDFGNVFYTDGQNVNLKIENSSFLFKGKDYKKENNLVRGDGLTLTVDKVETKSSEDKNPSASGEGYYGKAKATVVYYDDKGTKLDTKTPEINYTGDFSDWKIGTGVTEPTKNGYTFDGWYMKGTDGNLIDPNFDGKTINLLAYEPLDLYAKFTPEKHTITYTDGVDNEVIFNDQVYTREHDAATPPFLDANNNPIDPTRTGYTFAGWSPAVANTVTGDATYTATWTQDEYTVTYTDGVNGEAFEEQPYTNKHYGDPTPEFKGKPTRDGYNFKGWNPGVELTVTGNITYTAQWENIPYTITYTDGVDNEVIFKDQTYPNKYYDDDTPAFDGTPTRTGYIFEGWKLQLTTPGDTASIAWNPKVTGDATYVAQWTAIPYTITYKDGVNGTVFADQTATVNYGAATPAFNGTPTREGYTFAGWDPEVEETVIADATYTATWKKNDPQPPVNEPDGTKPDGTTPDGTTPDGTTPDGTKPDGTTPDGTTPDGTTPSETKPSETKPSETKPSETKPSETKPSETKPSETKPVKSVATGDNAPIVAVTVMVILSGIVLVMMGLRKKHFNN